MLRSFPLSFALGSISLFMLFNLACKPLADGSYPDPFQQAPPGGGGSNIRVVGGSIQIELYNGASWSMDTPTQLQVQKTDASTFTLKNVSQSQTGTPIDKPYTQLKGPWTIQETVQDQSGGVNRGLQIDGAGTASATVAFTLLHPQDDSFVKATSLIRKYKNGKAGLHCLFRSKDCEKIMALNITVNGNTKPETWYCVEPDRKCHIYIGPE